MTSVPVNTFSAGEAANLTEPAHAPPDSARCNLDTCARTAAELHAPLSRCAGCRTASYCSRDCQAADWTVHRRTCARTAATLLSSATVHQNFTNTNDSYNTGDAKAWLSSLPEITCYRAVSDAYRLRMAEERRPIGHSTELSVLYFMEFLGFAEERGVLPDTCNRRDAFNLASNQSEDACIYHPMEERAIAARYGDPNILENLRMVATRVYGMPVGAQ